MKKNEKVILYNGVEIPCIGYGTAESKDGKETVEKVVQALECGYRHIDTASIYGNEESVGKGIKESEVQREEIFLTSKVWNPDQGYQKTLDAFERSIEKLQTEYLDLYLIHWPVPMGHEEDYPDINYQTWRAMEKLYSDGKIKAIGVSNFLPRHLQYLLKRADIKPMVNQLEIHPLFQEIEAVEFCKKENIVVEAWSPFSRGGVFQVPFLQYLAEKYDKSVAQVCIRWSLQRGIIPLPKASTIKRMKENMDVFDFEIDTRDMELLLDLDNEDCHAPFRDYELQMNY